MSLEDSIKKDVQPWIDFLDYMRVLGVSESLPIPQIAVFGDQSSGKSSLLEALSGIPFPRGTGLVTRCPTCISLQQVEGVQWSAKIRITDRKKTVDEIETSSPTELSEKIVELTNILTDNDQNRLSKEGILIRVTAPNVSNLTIVDLPGIIRTTTTGQSKSVIADIDAMLDKVMSESRTIILAVIPANQDIATVDVLERAQRCDPHGLRTIGVLTKADLIDQGAESEVIAVVKNTRKPLALGYVIVKNRSQAQLKLGLSLKDAAANEADFFKNHPVWCNVDKNLWGIQSLTRKLTTVLVERVKASLPSIVSQIQVKLMDIDKELYDIGPEMSASDADMRKVLLRLVSRYSQVLRQVCEGDYRESLVQKNANLRVKYLATEIINELKVTLASRVPNFDADSFEEQLSKCMIDMRGKELPGFLSGKLLLSTISSDLVYWRQDVDNVIGRIIDVFARSSELLSAEMTVQFPRLHGVLVTVISECITAQVPEITRRVDEIFARGAEGAVNDTELMQCINQARFNRFEIAMRNVLDTLLGSSVVGSALPNPPSTGNTLYGSVGSGRDSVTSVPRSVSVDQSSTNAALKKMSIEDAREYVRRVLGHYYMEMHGVGEGGQGPKFNVHIEDARIVLKAFWSMSESRLNTDVESTVDQMILQKVSELIEQELLAKVQIWSGSSTKTKGKAVEKASGVLADLLSEDPAITKRRNELQHMKKQYNEAQKKIQEMSPQSVLTSTK